MILFHQTIFYLSYLAFPFVFLMGWIWYKYKTKTTKIVVALLLFLSFLFVYARFIEPRILVVNHDQIELNSEGDKSIKIAVFADNHIGVYKHAMSISRIVEKTNELDPDLVIIPGDFLYYLDVDEIEESFKDFSGFNAPTYAVTGNHDVGHPGEDFGDELIEIFAKFNVHVIDDEKINIQINDTLFDIIGLKDIWDSPVNNSLFNDLEDSDNVIVIAHNPDTAYAISEDAPVDLVISGHTHGGQVRLPFIYKYAIPTYNDFDKGLYDVENMKVYITSGTGMVGLPLRFLIPPEVVLLEVYGYN